VPLTCTVMNRHCVECGAAQTVICLIAVAALGYAVASLVALNDSKTLIAQHARREAQWLDEKSQLEAELMDARNRPAPAFTPLSQLAPPSAAGAAPAALTINAATAPDIVAVAAQWSLANGPKKNRDYRPLIADLEKLVALGPAAVPAIRDFLQQNQDAVFEAKGPPPCKGPKWKRDTAPPASLRAGLIDSLKRIGGPEAEQLLAETLTTTGRGYEVLIIAHALEGMAPGKYRDAVVSTAQTLLANMPPGDQPTRLDRMSKDYLNDVVREYGPPKVP
jgi:hypothetical protein